MLDCLVLYIIRPLYYILFVHILKTKSNSRNMSLDGVLYSACSIIRAARLWSFDSLSRLHEDVLPKVRDP